MKWYSMQTFREWIKNYFSILIVLKFLFKQKIRIAVYGGLFLGVYLFVPISQFYFGAKQELKEAVERNYLELECWDRFACMKGYNLDCGVFIPPWESIYGDETKEESEIRQKIEEKNEMIFKYNSTLDKVCSMKNLWPKE